MTVVPGRVPPSGAGPRRRLPAEERREQILSAARQVFIRSGLAGARTRDVAAEAGINEALLYRHFRSKDELFEAAVAAPLDAAIASLVERSGEPPIEFDGTADVMRERTRQFVEDLLGVMDEIAPLVGVVLFGEAEAASAYYRKRLAPALEKVEEIVEAHQAAWAHQDFDPELVVELVFGMTWFLVLSDRFGARQRDRSAMAATITRIIIDGLVQRPD